MVNVIKTILLPLLLASILSLSIALGCGGEKDDASGEFSQQELEQILADSTLLINQADSYKMNMEMDMFMDMSGSEEGTMDMDATMEGAFDQKNMEMYMTMEMYMAVDVGGQRESMDDIVMDIYLVDEYIYMKMNIPEMGEEWIKLPATEENMTAWDMNMVDQQLVPLESSGEMSFLRYENIDGSECYVIEFIPDTAAMMEWIGEQGLADLGFDWDDVEEIGKIFDELSYTCWIDKDTKQMKKMNAYILMKISGDVYEGLAGESGKITMDMNINMVIQDYNQPVSIVLPDEAEDAMGFDEFLM